MKILSSKKTFGTTHDMQVPYFNFHDDAILQDSVPMIDENYQFDDVTTTAICAGFAHNRRVMIHGFHGTGKSTHIEQVAARLKWPCIRLNLDGHIGRIDLIGKDAIELQDGKQITCFKPGILPWAMEHGVALVFDEYDAGRPDVLFVLQRLLESQGGLTLTDQNRVLKPHKHFRVFATANTIGLGDASGLYHGTNPINQGQMDRWNMVVQLNYLSPKHEEAIIAAKCPDLPSKNIAPMVEMANLTRTGFQAGDISTVMSPRTVLAWAENYDIINNLEQAFRMAFMNKCDMHEMPIIAGYYQRCFNEELAELAA